MSLLIRAALVGVVLGLAGCALPADDQPAHPARLGRFLGLVAQCGCTDISVSRMRVEYPKAAIGLYDEAAVKSLYGYVDWGLTENYDNQIEICREACSQSCMTASVVEKLDGRPASGTAACLISERDLHLTTGRYGNSFP